MTKRSLVAAGAFAVLTIAVPVAMQQAAQTQAVPAARAGSTVPARLAVRPAARIQDRAGDAGRQDRLADRRHVRCARPAGRVAERLRQRRRAAHPARQRRRRDFRVREDRLRQAQHLSRSLLREPDDALRELPRRDAGRPATGGGRARRRSASRRHSAGRRRGAASTAAAAARRRRQQPPPQPPAQQQAGAPPAQQQAAGAPTRRAARGGGRGGGGGGNQADPGIAGLYKLEDINGDDVMDTIERIQRYTSAGMGDHGPHADPPGARWLDHVPCRQQHLRRQSVAARLAGERRCRGQGEIAQLEQPQGAAVPAAVQRSAVRQQHADWRACHGLAARAGQ